MQEIIVDNCTKCPFCVVDIDFEATQNQIMLFCNLAQYIEEKPNLIAMYGLNSTKNRIVPPPSFCPLKEESVKVTLTGILS